MNTFVFTIYDSDQNETPYIKLSILVEKMFFNIFLDYKLITLFLHKFLDFLKVLQNSKSLKRLILPLIPFPRLKFSAGFNIHIFLLVESS
jgi:hypothetical protein